LKEPRRIGEAAAFRLPNTRRDFLYARGGLARDLGLARLGARRRPVLPGDRQTIGRFGMPILNGVADQQEMCGWGCGDVI
jgi:SLT domain-containing protein